jgi:TRAP-type C4-dicarboxylate transport system substrate-binding protein
MLCQRLAPALRVMRVAGLFQSREEALYVLGRLKPRLDSEFGKSGFTNLGEAGFGSDLIFSREPVRSLADLRRGRFWVWDLDDVWERQLPAMGMRIVRLPVQKAAQAYEERQTDGFLAISTAALAYQWSTRARYFTDLHLGYLMGCLVMSQAAFDPLPTSHQQVIREASSTLMRRVEDMGQRQDAALLGGLFEKQGMRRVPVEDIFRTEFLAAARAAREKALTSNALLQQVNAWLADFRAEHR